MAAVLNRVKVATATAGAGTITLGAAVAGSGNLYVGGYTDSEIAAGEANLGQEDGFVAKYSPTGTFVWASQIAQSSVDTKTFGGSVFYDRRSGSVWSIGSFAGGTTFNNFSGSGGTGFIARGVYDTFIIKYSA